MTQNGKEYMNKMKKHFSLPVISKLSSYKGNEISLDIRAAKIYAFGVSNNSKVELLNQEYKQPPIFIK
jgi:hypothetical protein